MKIEKGKDLLKISRFEQLDVWIKARQLVRETYTATSKNGMAGDLGLKDQMRRAAISTMANVAEGFERGGNKEFVQYLAQAKASCGELRSHLYAALDLGYLSEEEFGKLVDTALSVSRQASGLMKFLRRSVRRGSKYDPPAKPSS